MTKHIAFGVLLSIAAVVSGAEIKVGGDAGWTMQEYAPITAEVGDVLVFEFEAGHTVAKMDNPNCNFANSEPVADENASPFELELTEPGSITIASDVQGQCEAGMNLQVDVRPADDSADDSADDFGATENSGDARLTEDDFANEKDLGGGPRETSGNQYSGHHFMDHGDDDWWGGSWGDWGDWDDK